MDALTCLKTRRSIRAYEDRQVDEALLAQVLEAGMYAPTGMGVSRPRWWSCRTGQPVTSSAA